MVGVPQDQIQLNAFPLVFGGRSIYGTLTAMIETFPLEQAADAYARMMEGKARFRVVLVTGAI